MARRQTSINIACYIGPRNPPVRRIFGIRGDLGVYEGLAGEIPKHWETPSWCISAFPHRFKLWPIQTGEKDLKCLMI